MLSRQLSGSNPDFYEKTTTRRHTKTTYKVHKRKTGIFLWDTVFYFNFHQSFLNIPILCTVCFPVKYAEDLIYGEKDIFIS
jgi:hypothetical protein